MSLRRLTTALLGLSIAAASAHAAPNPWPELARADLRAVHDTLEANHPGPVDPLNPGYRRWLEEGLRDAEQRAAEASSYEDYRQALRYYANGFRDGHIGVHFELAYDTLRWPQFLLGGEAGRVAVVTDETRALQGARLLACEGQTLDALMAQHVDPYRWNRDIPHARFQQQRWLFMNAGPKRLPFKQCRFEGRDGKTFDHTLAWRWIELPQAEARLQEAVGQVRPALGVRQVGGVWFVSLPSFSYSSEAQTAQFRRFLKDLAAQRQRLWQAPRVVIDVRGNEGGNSAWGDEVVRTLWGDAALKHVQSRFDDTTDWRASADNIATSVAEIELNQRQGLAQAQQYRQRVLDALRAAQQRGEPLARVEEPADPVPGPAPASPFKGKVYFLTDHACFSACLDLADVLRRLPGVTHIGLPTQADAVYIDNTSAELPSGLAGLSYSMKVYRHRVRGNNEWYEPARQWPGGPMTDAALARWIRQSL